MMVSGSLFSGNLWFGRFFVAQDAHGWGAGVFELAGLYRPDKSPQERQSQRQADKNEKKNDKHN
jgi:hypothetical protein